MNASDEPDLTALRPVLPDGLPHDRAEPGCLEFTPYENPLWPGRFHLVEVYASTAAFGEHLGAPHVQQFWRTLLTCSSNHDASKLTQLVEVDV